MVALSEKVRPRSAPAGPPPSGDAIPLSLRQRGGTPRQVLAMTVIGTPPLAVFAAPDLSSWLDRMGGGPILEPLQNTAAEWNAEMTRLDLDGAARGASGRDAAGVGMAMGGSAALKRFSIRLLASIMARRLDPGGSFRISSKIVAADVDARAKPGQRVLGVEVQCAKNPDLHRTGLPYPGALRRRDPQAKPADHDFEKIRVVPMRHETFCP